MAGRHWRCRCVYGSLLWRQVANRSCGHGRWQSWVTFCCVAEEVEAMLRGRHLPVTTFTVSLNDLAFVHGKLISMHLNSYLKEVVKTLHR